MKSCAAISWCFSAIIVFTTIIFVLIDSGDATHHGRHERHSGVGTGAHLATTQQNSITCYKCNSEYDPRCGDPFDPYTLGTVNCSLLPPPEHLPNVQATLCRKTVQKVYGKIRVVRGCGYITDPRDGLECMKRSGTHDVYALYCSCTSDLCNGTPSILAPTGATTILASALAILLQAYYLHYLC